MSIKKSSLYILIAKYYKDPAAAKLLQSCLTLSDHMDFGPPDSSVHGILQARTGVGFHAFLQGFFLTQGSNPHRFRLLH